MKRRIFLVGAAMVLLAALFYGLMPGDAKAVETTLVTREDFVKTVEASGLAAARNTKLVTVPFTGVVSGIFVKEGQQVKNGDSLFQMAAGTIEEELEQAQLQLSSLAGSGTAVFSQGGEGDISEEQERLLSLAQSGSASYESFAQGFGVSEDTAAFSGESTELKAARLKVEKLEEQLAAATVVCSEDAEVLQVGIQEGVAAQGDTAAVLLGLGGEIVVESQIGERDLKYIEEGQSVSVTCEAVSADSYGGVVTQKADAIERSSDVAEATGTVTIEPEGMQAMVGATCQVSIEYLRLSGVLILPMECLMEDGDGQSYVFAVQDGKAVKTQICIGEMDGYNMVIEEGLDENQRVILNPADVTDGEAVEDDGGAD